MKDLYRLKEKLCEELEEYAGEIKLTAGSLDIIHKITDSIKNIDKIELLEGGEYGGSYDDGMSYARRGGGTYVRGYYRDDDGRMGGRRYSRDGGDYDREMSMRRYSRDGGKDQMLKKMGEMMEYAETDQQREALKRCMRQLEEL